MAAAGGMPEQPQGCAMRCGPQGPPAGGADSVAPAKRARLGEPVPGGAAAGSEVLGGGASGSLDEEVEAMLSDEALKEAAGEPPAPEPPQEAARRAFAERLAAKAQIAKDDLVQLLLEVRDEAPDWGPVRRLRSAALLLVYVARSSRACRASFAAKGMPLLGEVLQEGIGRIEQGTAGERQDAGMRVLACLTCLWALPIGRATMWEHRTSVGKAFDRLHRWCGQAGTALAAELQVPTSALCRRWKGQPRPALQDPSPEQRTVRLKVVDVIKLGLLGIAGTSPGSPSPTSSRSPDILPPALVAAEVEAALFGIHGGSTAEYRHHARMLKTNLVHPGNAPLRASLLSGDMSARELVTMDHQSLAPQELQERRKAAANKVLKEITLKVAETVLSVDDIRDQTYTPVVPDVEFPMAEPEPDPDPAPPAEETPRKEATAAPSPFPFLEPLPTPFRDGVHPPTPMRGGTGGAFAVPPTPEMLTTPAAQEETENESELIRWLSQRVL
uniref:TFIIS central domain-containing protein n=1 Tax=Alexandrium monilatum TaxID=311494 RepID=A0A7S4QJ72_9DINO